MDSEIQRESHFRFNAVLLAVTFSLMLMHQI